MNFVRIPLLNNWMLNLWWNFNIKMKKNLKKPNVKQGLYEQSLNEQKPN
jgi:hypothetical protein